MLARVLTPLNKGEQALLIAIQCFGGEHRDALIACLVEEKKIRILEKREKLDAIPREKRVYLMLSYLKKLLSYRGAMGVDTVETSWLISGFKGESPRTIAIVLMHMPSFIRRQIMSRLPKDVRDAVPDREELRDVPMVVVKMVRSCFDAKFMLMPDQLQDDSFSFREIIILKPKELIILIRQLGMLEVAKAFIVMGRRALARFMSKMPKDQSAAFIVTVKKAAESELRDAKGVQVFFKKIMKNFDHIDELFQKAGLYSISRSVQDGEEVFLRQLQQRFPRSHGRLLERYFKIIKEFEEVAPDSQTALRDEILQEMIDLSRRGKIDGNYFTRNIIFEGSKS